MTSAPAAERGAAEAGGAAPGPSTASASEASSLTFAAAGQAAAGRAPGSSEPTPGLAEPLVGSTMHALETWANLRKNAITPSTVVAAEDVGKRKVRCSARSRMFVVVCASVRAVEGYMRAHRLCIRATNEGIDDGA